MKLKYTNNPGVFIFLIKFPFFLFLMVWGKITWDYDFTLKIFNWRFDYTTLRDDK